MIAIVTGDIKGSTQHKSGEWLPVLQQYLSRFGENPMDWDVYRGDEFQWRLPAPEALSAAICLKAMLKTIKGLDVRMAIGLGTEDFKGKSIGESNGTAHQRSGKLFGQLKSKKMTLALATGQSDLDTTLNLMLKLALDFMDCWTQVSAQVVFNAMDKPKATQKELAEQLGIKQSAVSQRQKRARMGLVQELLAYYDAALKNVDA